MNTIGKKIDGNAAEPFYCACQTSWAQCRGGTTCPIINSTDVWEPSTSWYPPQPVLDWQVCCKLSALIVTSCFTRRAFMSCSKPTSGFPCSACPGVCGGNINLFSLIKTILVAFVQALFHVSLSILYAYTLVLIIGTYVIIVLLIGYSALMR